MPDFVVYANLTDEIGETGELLDMLTRGRPAWHRDAACREHRELSWFPARGEPSAAAKAVCAACLVRAECLAFALADPDLAGVWAGTTAQERRKLRNGLAA